MTASEPQRTPIKNYSTPADVQVQVLQEPVGLARVTPDYRYGITNYNVEPEADEMWADLMRFLAENESMIPKDVSSTADYVEGFKRSLALVRLWIDGIYVLKPEEAQQ